MSNERAFVSMTIAACMRGLQSAGPHWTREIAFAMFDVRKI
jgi:hypothetical protein